MNIILFDGVCNLCNSTVLFLINHDAKINLHFVAQQTEVGKRIMHQHAILDECNSIIFIMDEKIYYKSEAVIEIAKLLTGWPHFFKYTALLPKFIRDGVYNLIAKNRYSLFGKKSTCMMPSKSNKERFLIESSNYNK